MAEVDHVQVHFQDLVLGEPGSQVLGDHRLTHLAVQRAADALLVGINEVARELLGDGRGSRKLLAAGAVVENGTHDGAPIDSRVAVKSLVFSRNDGLAHQGADAVQGHPVTMAFVPKLADAGAIPVKKLSAEKEFRRRTGQVGHVGLDNLGQRLALVAVSGGGTGGAAQAPKTGAMMTSATKIQSQGACLDQRISTSGWWCQIRRASTIWYMLL